VNESLAVISNDHTAASVKCGDRIPTVAHIRNITMSNSNAKLSLREGLIATTDEGKIELTERELSRVGGGIKVGQTIKFSPWKYDVA
jgi:hypothetical protein